MVDIRENYKFDLGVKELMLLTFLLSFLSLVFWPHVVNYGFHLVQNCFLGYFLSICNCFWTCNCLKKILKPEEKRKLRVCLRYSSTQVPQRIHIRKYNLRQKHLTNLKMSYKIAKEYKSEFSKLYVDWEIESCWILVGNGSL